MFDVIFDIDGTIADLEHRRDYVRTKPKNWPAFRAGIPHDKPIEPVIQVLRALKAAGCTIILASGRDDGTQRQTEEWLDKHDIPYDALYMRKNKDYRRDDFVKKEILDQIRQDGYDPIITFDDRNQVVDMWRANGLVCAQVAPGDF